MNQNLTYSIIIFIFTLIIYSNTLSNSFVWDDHYFIEERTEIREWKNIFSFFSKDVFNVYRPVRKIFYLIAYKTFNLNPFLHHLFGILIHAANSIIIFIILLKIIKKKQIAFILSILFSAHPIHVESVAFATSNFDLIGILFFLISFYFFIRTKYPISLIFFALAAFSYEMSLSLPFIILLYIFCFSNDKISIKNNGNNPNDNKSITNNNNKNNNNHSNKKNKSKNTFEKYTIALPYFAVAFSYIFIRFFLINLISRTQISFSEHTFRILAFPKIIFIYIWNFIFPINLTTQHLMSYSFNFEVILSIISLLIILPILFINYKKHPLLFFSAAWLIITLLPVSNIIPIQRGFAEMYAYLPSLGFLIFLYYILYLIISSSVSNKKTIKNRLFIFFVILLLFYSITTFQRNKDWKDDLSLWIATIKTTPESSKANTNLALELAKIGELDYAMFHAEKAIHINPKKPNLYYNLGTIYEKAGYLNESLAAYIKAIEFNPNDNQAYINTAIILAKKKEFEKAEQLLLKSIQLKPSSKAHFNLAMVYKEMNMTENTIKHLQASLQLNPDFTIAKNYLEALEKQ